MKAMKEMKVKVMKPMKAKVIKESTDENAKVMKAKAKTSENAAVETAEIEEIAEQIATAVTLHQNHFDECLKQIIWILS